MPWFILDRAGVSLPPEQLPERPEDAHTDSGDAFTPWYKNDEHLHVENGSIQGIHTQAATEEEARQRLLFFLGHEATLLEKFGGQEDILIPQAEEVLTGKDG